MIPGFFGDDLDALELDTEPMPFTYFSVDFLSLSAPSEDILVSIGDGMFSTYASGINDIGLQAGDDIDALVLIDILDGDLDPLADPGVDMALFSLNTFSPSTFTGGIGSVSPADILFTNFDGSFSLWASAADIGLRPDDELDALDTVIPEPSTIFLMAIGFVGLVCYQYRLRRKSIS